MPLLSVSVKHGHTLEEARGRMQTAVDQVRANFGVLVQRVEWSADRSEAKIVGTGFWLDLRVDSQDVHLTGDSPLLGGFLGSPMIAGLKNILQQTFQKRLR